VTGACSTWRICRDWRIVQACRSPQHSVTT
jgi:hypothetical protein